MKFLYCIKIEKYTEFKNPKISCICDEKLFFSTICDKCGCNNNKAFQEEESKW